MCLIFAAYRAHPRYRLVIAANRDEFHARPTARAGWWEDAPAVLGGRDLRSGGSWLGVARSGRVAAITNYREPGERRSDAPSRGWLVSGYLQGGQSAREFLEELAPVAGEYNGFSLLLADADGLYYFSNRADGVQALPPGVYGLSNHLLETPWPKVLRGKARLAAQLEQAELAAEELLEMLADPTRPDERRLPDTGVGTDWERVLAPMFIRSPTYGTRSSSVVLVGADGRVEFVERGYEPDGTRQPTLRFAFTLEGA